jgi:1,4-alpha-glucan branching enzyme
MIEKHWRSSGRDLSTGAVAVTFEVPARPDVESVAVVGDFNGWSTSAHVLSRTDMGYRTTVDLVPGCRYRFKYLINGERWENDWAADDYVANEHGGDDTVVDLLTPRGSPPTVRQ